MIQSFLTKVSLVLGVSLIVSSCSQRRTPKNELVFDLSKIKSTSCFNYSKEQIHSYFAVADLPCIKKALEKDIDPNGEYLDPISGKTTPYLFMALDSGALFHAKYGRGSSSAIMELLLNFGADVNTVKNGVSLLESAMRLDPQYQGVALAMIRFVAKDGGQKEFNPNVVSAGGSPLEIAIALKNSEFVSALVSRHPNLEQQTRGATPLIQALSAGFEDAATSLVQAGALVDVFDANQNSALMLSMQKQYLSLFESILAKTKVIDFPNSNFETPLIFSAKLMNRVYFDKLLPLSKAINEVDSYKKSAIFYLVQNSDLERVKAAYNAGADVQLMASDSSTLLHLVRNPDIATFLLETKKMSIDEMNRYRRTPLAAAVESQNSGVAMVLAAYGASVHYLSPQLDSLLHIAVRNNDLATARFLISKGLEIEAQNTAKETPVFGVASLEMAKLMAEHQANFSKTNARGQNLLVSLFRNTLPTKELLSFVLDQGTPGVTYLDNGYTPVHVLAGNFGYPREMRMDLMDILLSHGVSLDLMTRPYRRPALHLAADDLVWIKYFAKHHADLSIADGSGRTLASMARDQIESLKAQIAALEGSKEDLSPYQKKLAQQIEIRDFLASEGAVNQF